MEINQSKLQRQLKAIDNWVNIGKGVGRIIQPTGFGKTYEELLIADKYHNKHYNDVILFIANNEAGKNNFYKALNNLKHLFDNIIRDNLIITTKNQILTNLHFYESRTFNLVIVDEIHDFVSEQAYGIIAKKYFNYKFIVGFTGSDPTDKDKKKLDAYIPVVDFISYDEAIANKWISDFTEYNVALNLTKEDQIVYDTFSEYIRDTLNLVDNNYLTVINMGKNMYNKLLGRVVKYDEICEKVAMENNWTRDLDLSNGYYANINKVFSPSNLHERAKTFLLYVERRNALMDANILKIQAILDTVRLLKGKKIIIFNNQIEVIDILHLLINNSIWNVRKYKSLIDIRGAIGYHTMLSTNDTVVKYHSKLKSTQILDHENGGYLRYKNGKIKQFGTDAQKSFVMEQISSGRAKVILAVKGLDSALNVEDLDASIITGGSTNPLQQTQRKGRSLRISEYKKLAYVINIYFANTRDEQKLNQRQKESTNKIVRINNVNEILI